MNDIYLIKKINNFFLQNIRTQLAIIVSGLELLDFEQEFIEVKDSINFSSFLIDSYDILLSILLDTTERGSKEVNEDLIIVEDKLSKIIDIFNGFKSNNVKILLKIKDKCEVRCNTLVFKNFITVVLAESIKLVSEKLVVEVNDKSIFIYLNAEDFPQILLEINKLMEKYGILLYKAKSYIEVRFK